MKKCALLLAAAALAACAARRPSLKADSTASPTIALSTAPAEAVAPAAPIAPDAPPTEVAEASLRGGGEFAARADLKAVRFDFDSAALSDEALEALKSNAEAIKAEPRLEVRVAGHCDERGTTAYNLALGQKRAKEVRDYYIRLGVDGRRIATISYGEENPLCAQPDEACWTQNRRAETTARTAAAPAP
ncbi:MAG: OmpA family protein [Elusimicrobia bacterium]|nr:OmpA family protein [Elusimicrobiota bacterium]